MLQVKICGFTDLEQAYSCSLLGTDAIGFVFYPRSPRFVKKELVKEICKILPEKITTVGVFVNEAFEKVLQIANYCELKAIQLHGQEDFTYVNKLIEQNFLIIKSLFINSEPSLEKAFKYLEYFNLAKSSRLNNLSNLAFIVEHGKGNLPGGNAQTWDWSKAKDFSKKYPLVLAGGMSINNVLEAVNLLNPDAIDVSSSVEISPGKKDIKKVQEFIKIVKNINLNNENKQMRKIF